MPIFAYFSVVGVALLALLFVADANLDKRGPLTISTNFEGLPKPWKPELNPPLPQAKPPAIQAAAAPPLDPTWNGDKSAAVAAAPQSAPSGPQHVAQAEPKKPKRAVHKQARRDGRDAYAQHFAWRHDDGGWFGGNPWRF